MKLRIEPGIKILQSIDRLSELNYTTVVLFNKRRKQLLSKMKDINPFLFTKKEKEFWSLIRPRKSQNLLGVKMTREERDFEDKLVKYAQILTFRRNRFCDLYH